MDLSGSLVGDSNIAVAKTSRMLEPIASRIRHASASALGSIDSDTARKDQGVQRSHCWLHLLNNRLCKLFQVLRYFLS